MIDEDVAGRDRAHCADCGGYPAFVPRVHVPNIQTREVDLHHLRLPHLCDTCAHKRGLSRHGILIAKYEGDNLTTAAERFIKGIPDFIAAVQEKQIADLKDQGMSEDDAKSLLGVK